MPPSDDHAIELRDLTRRFGRALAVDRVSMSVPRGAVFAFLGPNGAGKTTTIRMTLGLIRPTSGSALVLGAPVREQRREALSRIGSMVEGPSLYPHLTGPENLRVYARLTGARRERIPAILDRVGLAGAGKKRVKAFSLGMRQRLGLAIAMLHDPDIFILDEPTNGLDPAGVREMRDLFRDLASAGRTVFVSSHLLSEVEQIATHVGVIVSGRLVFSGEIGALRERTSPTLEADVDDPELAASVCERRGLEFSARDGAIRVSSAVDPAELNAALVSAGARVSRLQLVRPNLEDVFFELTGPTGAQEEANES